MKLADLVMWRGRVPAVVVLELVERASPAVLVVVVVAVTKNTGEMVVFPSVRGLFVHAPPLDVATPNRVIECTDVVGAGVEQAQLAT